jgi:rubrerythrin
VANETQGAERPPAVSNAEIVKGLNDLLQLDHDAIGAYQIAIEELEERSYARQIQRLLHDHERHVRELNGLIQWLGGKPKNEPHATGPFKQALQGLGRLGGDRGALMAFRSNELRVRAAYHEYATRAAAWPPDVLTIIDRAARDEDRHYRWVTGVLDAMPGPADAAVRRGLRLRGAVEEEVRSGPVRALLFAFAAGLTIGRIIR